MFHTLDEMRHEFPRHWCPETPVTLILPGVGKRFACYAVALFQAEPTFAEPVYVKEIDGDLAEYQASELLEDADGVFVRFDPDPGNPRPRTHRWDVIKISGGTAAITLHCRYHKEL